MTYAPEHEKELRNRSHRHRMGVLGPLVGDPRSYEVEFFAARRFSVPAPSHEHLTSAVWRRTIGPQSQVKPADSRANQGGLQWLSISCASVTHLRHGRSYFRTLKIAAMQRARTSNRWGAPYTAFGMASANTTAYAIYEAPDNVSMAGAVLAITSGGALASVETTVLMTVEETLEALAKGKDIGYRRPGES